MQRPTRTRRTLLTAAACAASLVLAATGCSSSSGGKDAQEAPDDSVAGKAGTPRMKVAMVTHGASGDTFWDIVRKGAEAAAQKDNVQLVYSSDPSASDQAALVQNAIDQNVDGIAVTASKPEALRSVLAKAEKAGIPVVGLNAGLEQWQDLGMLSYFGQDERIAGEAFGERLNEEGAQRALCVIHEQGSVSLQARCAGVKDTFRGTTDTVYVNGADMPSVKATLQAKLQQDDDYDYVVTLGAPIANTAVTAASDAGNDAAVATFDLNTELVGALKAGDIAFAVDQQPYLQGYLAVDALWLYEHNGNISGGGKEPVLTGPAFVDAENIDEIAGFARKGTR
jgi:simple sugar transport system substrate-binding protein